MRTISILLFTFLTVLAYAQNQALETVEKDSVLLIKKNPEKGFMSDYLLFLHKGTPLDKKLTLLVEPNNTGKTSDSMEVHTAYAIDLASASSVGNNISTMLKIPLLVPIFPRPSARDLVYTHALDRDVMEENSGEFERLDLQLLAMISDARNILDSLHILTEQQIFMSGFSASGTFVNRFSFLHPEHIKALAIGGFNGELILPQKRLNGVKLNYPLGTKDFKRLVGRKFALDAYQRIPQFIYMGKLDENDAVQFDDAYSEKERSIVNTEIGNTVQDRYVHCQSLYQQRGISPIFKTYENIGHWTTSEMNMEVIRFFFAQLKEQ